MKRFVSSLLVVFLLVAIGSVPAILSQGEPVEQAPAPTLIPPTPVPFMPTETTAIFPNESAVARIQANGVVRVGFLYNAPPFGELNIRGEHAGYDADLARSMAEVWDVEVEFVQVTRQTENSVQMLQHGEVDLLIAAQVHHRSLDSLLEFSQTYYLGQQSILVRSDDPATNPLSMADRIWGVTIATPAHEAVNDWIGRNGLSTPVQTFLTLDQAYSALLNGQIDGVVDSDYRLLQVSAVRPDQTRILETPVSLEPVAVAVMRQDANMRNLVNRTLQYLTNTERMGEIHRAYFPGQSYDLLLPWNNLGGDAPTLDQYSGGLVFPSVYVVPQMQASGVIRVAGLIDSGTDVSESARRLNAFHEELLRQMAGRWGVRVEFVPNSADNALDLVASGQADIAVGVTPDWNWASRVDFTSIYLLHGERLMVRTDYEFEGFSGLRGGKIVVTPSNETTAAGRAIELAESINVRIEISQQPEADLAFALLGDDSYDVEAVFGDSLKLIPHIQQNPDALRLTLTDDGSAGRWYSEASRPVAMAMAVPLNDIDFRLLVEYTLQELVRDSTLERMLQPLMLPEDIPAFEIWPGSSEYLGFSLAQ